MKRAPTPSVADVVRVTAVMMELTPRTTTAPRSHLNTGFQLSPLFLPFVATGDLQKKRQIVLTIFPLVS